MTPVWLLDVDGVLNAMWDQTPWPETTGATVRFPGWSRHWVWSPNLVERIRALEAEGLVEIEWATTWAPHAGLLNETFGLHGAPMYLSENKTRDKFAAAVYQVQHGRPYVWTDDEHVPEVESAAWHYLNSDALLIKPDGRYGLTPEHMDAIEVFLRRR